MTVLKNMTKIIVLVLTVTLLSTTTFAASVGDVNNDGKISTLDLVYLARHLADWTGYETLGPVEEEDENIDDTVDIDDIVKRMNEVPVLVEGYSSFQVNNFVLMDAYIDGKLEHIKVRNVIKGNKIVKLNQLDRTQLLKELEKGVFGVYKYVKEADGYYSLMQSVLPYEVSDFATGTSMNFRDGLITNVNTTGLPDGVDKRNVMLRITSNTIIYVADTAQNEIIPIEAKASGDFVINVGAGSTFYADKIGYGINDPSIKDEDITWEHGVASLVYIEIN